MDGQALAAKRTRRSSTRANRDAIGRQTLHAAATAANEVGVFLIVSALAFQQFETPHVVSDVGPPGEAALRQVNQIAIERRSVESAAGEPIHDIRVRHGCLGRSELSQHG